MSVAAVPRSVYDRWGLCTIGGMRAAYAELLHGATPERDDWRYQAESG